MGRSSILGKCFAIMLGVGGLSSAFVWVNANQASSRLNKRGAILAEQSQRSESNVETSSVTSEDRVRVEELSEIKVEREVDELKAKSEPPAEMVGDARALEQESHTLLPNYRDDGISGSQSLVPVVNIPLETEESQDLQNNWFSLDSKYLESLDQEELEPKECSKSETKGKALIRCPWILSTPQTTIGFYFDLSLNPKLSGKILDNLQELKVVPRSKELIILGMVFSDNISEEIEINLSYRKS